MNYETVKAGKYKDIYAGNRLLSEEERKIAQERVDFSYQLFIEDVANNRNMELEEVE